MGWVKYIILMRIITLFIIALYGFCFHKEETVCARYKLISVTSINPEDTLKIEDWRLLDTSNIYLNDRLVMINTFESYSKGNLSYVILKFEKSNKGGSRLDNPDEHVLIDYKDQILYLLDNNSALPLYRHDNLIVGSHEKDSVINKELQDSSEIALICFDRKLPKSLKAKYVNEHNPYGVRSILTASQNMELISYSRNDKYDIDSILTVAKKKCKRMNKKIDLLFFNKNK